MVPTWLLTRTAPFLFAALAIAQVSRAETSALWGEAGEAFDPAGRLMDWSYAGYRYGESELPIAAVTFDVTDFGATPGDAGDDTAGFKAAIAAAAAQGGVVWVPSGTYSLSQRLILPDHVVLRGAGPENTIIEIPLSLTALDGNPGLEGGGTSSYSFVGAFIEAHGRDDGAELTKVTGHADRGSKTIQVETTSGLSVGQWVRVMQVDVGGSLIDRLHSGLMQGGTDNMGDRATNFHSRIASIAGGSIELERALPIDIDTAWSPRVFAFEPTVSEVGVEDLTIQFPLTSYPGHFNEQGFNAIDFDTVANSWVKNVQIWNADYGVNLRDSYFVTVADVILDTTGDRGGISGHHGINNGHGSDNLIIGFDIRTTFQHDLTAEWYATGVVFTKGRGDNLRMDHHRAAPYSTLWTEIDCGEGTQAFTSGGRNDRGPQTGSYDTLWNVRADKKMNLPANDYGPRMNFIGFQTSATGVNSPYEWWFESVGPDEIEPRNLWEAMRARRVIEVVDPEETGGSPAGTGGAPGSGGSAEPETPDPTTGGFSPLPMTGGATGFSPDPAAGENGCNCSVMGAGSRKPLGFGVVVFALFLGGLRRRRGSTVA